MATCLVGLGSNLGNRHENLDRAKEHLAAWDAVTDIQVSTWVATPPVGGPGGQSAFANGALRFETEAPPSRILTKLLEIEQTLGRTRRVRWGPRTLDLDLLLYGDRIVAEEGLSIPHPWMATRRFVLQPAVQVAADLIHPEIGWDLRKLWDNLENARYIAVAGASTEELRQLVRRAAEKAQVDFLPNSVGVGSKNPDRLEFAKQLRQVADATCSASAEFFVSDFWWEEVLTASDPLFDEESSRQPNLVIVLLSDQSTLDQRQRQRQADILARSSRFGRGPFLRLSVHDRHRLEHDITAAVMGMRKSTDHKRLP